MIFSENKFFRYLTNNAYKCVSRKELWESLTTYAFHGTQNEILQQIIEPWLINEGIPEVIARYHSIYNI